MITVTPSVFIPCIVVFVCKNYMYVINLQLEHQPADYEDTTNNDKLRFLTHDPNESNVMKKAAIM